MSGKKIRLGAFGLGMRATGLLKLYVQHPDIYLSAVCDRFPGNIRLTKEHLGRDDFHTYLSYEDMMREEELDALFIAIDPDKQVAFACDAMERGLHVMTEVPCAYTVEQCWRLVDTVERTGRLYQLGEQTRYMYFIRKWREMYEAGAFGHILFMEGEYMHYDIWDNYVDMSSGNFYHDREGKIIPHVNGERREELDEKRLEPSWRYETFKHPIYYLPHELSPLLSITGDRVERVSCMGTRPQSYTDPDISAENRDIEVAIMRTTGDTVMRLAAGFTSPHPFRRDTYSHWYHVKGTKADAEWSRTETDGSKLWTVEEGWKENVWPLADPDASEIAKSSSHGGLDWYPIEAFARAIADNTSPPMDVYRAVESAAPAILAARSSELGGVMLEVPDFRAKYRR